MHGETKACRRFDLSNNEQYDILRKKVKNMKEVDARGLSCPEPLMMTADALKNADGPIKVLVSEPHQKTNVEKFAKDRGKKATTTQKGSEFEIVIE